MLICVAEHASIFQANLYPAERGLEWEENLAQGKTSFPTQSLFFA